MRAALFLVGFYGATLLLCLAYLPLLALPRRWFAVLVRVWSRVGLWCWRTCGVRYRLEGREHLPAGAVILAAKHQSMWETIAFNVLFPDATYVLKRELLRIPILGWHLRKMCNIAIDRGGGAAALTTMLEQVGRAVVEGRPVVIFPEGTRGLPDRPAAPYHPGVAALYGRFGVPVVPVALDSGVFVNRDGTPRRTGVVTVRCLPPSPAGLTRRAFLSDLRARIETASAALARSATGDFGLDHGVVVSDQIQNRIQDDNNA